MNRNLYLRILSKLKKKTFIRFSNFIHCSSEQQQSRCQSLRHAAVTEALDRTNGNYRAVQQFSRHRDPAIIMKYDDNRKDLGGEVSRLVESGVTR